MPRFRSKPSEIEAIRWEPGEPAPLMLRAVIYDPTIKKQVGCVESLNGFVGVTEGDWIATEPDGVHYYPIKPEVFEARWEPITINPLHSDGIL